MSYRPSNGHLAALATGVTVAVKIRAVGKVHAPPFYHGCIPLVASISVSAGGNAAECTDPACSVYGTKSPQGAPQSQTESAAFGGLPLSALASVIVGGTSVFLLLSTALTLEVTDSKEDIGIGKGFKKAVVSFIGWGATSLVAAVCLLESLHRGSFEELKTELKEDIKELKTELKEDIKELKEEIKEVKTDLKVLLQDVAFIKGALTNKKK